jgi:hypothetical protein
MMLTVHPGRLEQPPLDTGRFFQRKVIAWLGDWHRRQGHQWSAVWVRENYLAHHREHMHMLLHVPKRLQGKLARALTRRWPEPEVVDLKPVYDEKGAISYIVKQLTPQAHFAVGRSVRRERHCRHDKALVAVVLGLRANMTRDLERLVRRLELEAALIQADEPAAILAIDRGAGGCHAR